MDIVIMDMDTLISTMAERRGKLKLHLLLRLMLRLIPGMDTMADIMDIVIMDMDTPIFMAERRGKLRLIPIMDIIDTMDTIPTTDMDICMVERGGKLRLSPKLKLKLIPKLIPGMDTMDTILVDIMDMDTMDTLMPDMDTTGVKGGIRLQYL